MAFGHTIDEETSARLRNLIGHHDITEVTAYDAEYPDEDQQRWVSLTCTGGAEDVQIDLQADEHADLNMLIEDEAEHQGETCKFFLQLVPTVHIKAKVENIYEDGEEITTHVEVSTPEPPDDEDSEEYSDWADEWLRDLTGTGKTEGDAGYFMTITEASDSTLVGREFEWGT